MAYMHLRGNLLFGRRVENGLGGRGVGGWREGAGAGEGGRFPELGKGHVNGDVG